MARQKLGPQINLLGSVVVRLVDVNVGGRLNNLDDDDDDNITRRDLKSIGAGPRRFPALLSFPSEQSPHLVKSQRPATTTANSNRHTNSDRPIATNVPTATDPQATVADSWQPTHTADRASEQLNHRDRLTATDTQYFYVNTRYHRPLDAIDKYPIVQVYRYCLSSSLTSSFISWIASWVFYFPFSISTSY